ncbi:MAG: hypothetical protein U0169_24655 [Polyangiaceae bacterium]
MKAIGAAALVAVLGLSDLAPIQCGSSSPVAREETAGDALYALANDFKAKGERDAARGTLRYLVEKYPASRFAPAAKEELDGASSPPSTRPASTGATAPGPDAGSASR